MNKLEWDPCSECMTIRYLLLWIEKVATDRQLDAPVGSLGNKTMREFLKTEDEYKFFKEIIDGLESL